jgi:CubicO group peptidase (beta-lactamase class C family)
LFQPLGISDYEWTIDPQGVASGHIGLSITPRDMAKLGFLYLNNGTWDGEQLVPSTWVSASTQGQVVDAYAGDDYGFQWWVDSYRDAYYALGRDGQYIWVQPENDLIVVFTASGPYYDWLIPMYILPAILPHDWTPPTTNTTTTTTTTTTTNGGTDEPGLDMTLILGGSAAAVALVIVIILTIKRRQ